MPATVAAARWDAEAPAASTAFPGAEASRSALYGGLVGDMIGELEQRVAARPEAAPDVFHRASVAVGYLSLAAGCAATVLGLAALF